VHWHTTRMPSRRWDVGMVHEDNHDRALRLYDLMPTQELSVHGEQLDARLLSSPTCPSSCKATLAASDR
jgi:hypothetical protein